MSGTSTVERHVEPVLQAGIDAAKSGPIGYEIRDLRITASDDVAFSRSLNWIRGMRTNDEETDVWVRATVCYHRKRREVGDHA